MCSKFCVKFQRALLKVHIKFGTHSHHPNVHSTGLYLGVWVTISLNCGVISRRYPISDQFRFCRIFTSKRDKVGRSILGLIYELPWTRHCLIHHASSCYPSSRHDTCEGQSFMAVNIVDSVRLKYRRTQTTERKHFCFEVLSTRKSNTKTEIRPITVWFTKI